MKCQQTGREVNSIHDYLDILSTLTNSLVEPSVIEYLERIWICRSGNQKDNSDSSSDDDNEEDDKTYSENELEAIIFYFYL